MSTTTVEIADIAPIDWNASGTDAVMQRVRNLLSLRQYEVAFDRGRGIDADLLDQPVDRVLGVLTNEISELLAIYEPAAELDSVTVGEDGKIRVKVKVAA